METNKVINGKTTIADFKKEFENIELSGYIWMVEGKEPIISPPKKIDFANLNAKGNAYNKIQEAYLTNGTYSIHIKNIDGIEHIYVFCEDDFSNDEFKIDDEERYPTHIIGIDTIHFKQVYELMPSISGDDFKTWQPIVKLFVKLEPKKD